MGVAQRVLCLDAEVGIFYAEDGRERADQEHVMTSAFWGCWRILGEGFGCDKGGLECAQAGVD